MGGSSAAQDSPAPDAQSDTNRDLVPVTKDSLLVVFIHGFKGTDETFLSFPDRLHHILTETLDNCGSVECIVFPAYETKGDLNEAVVRFADWLTTLTVEKEVASGGGAGSAKIVLCGHSMGGLLAADTLLEFIKSRPDSKAPLWPKIVACLAFDTPYLGLHPYVFKNTVSKAGEYVSAAKTIGSAVFGSLWSQKAAPQGAQSRLALPAPETSGWAKWAPAAYAVGGAMLAGAAAGGAYYKRDDIGSGYAWATDHMKYVKNLWDEGALECRLDGLVNADKEDQVIFRIFYTLLPPAPPLHASSRTFVVLPTSKHKARPHFIPAKNSQAPDELQAHTGMFSAATNDGYYDLGLQTAMLIRETVQTSRGIIDKSVRDDQKEREADLGFEESEETKDKAKSAVVSESEVGTASESASTPAE